MQMIYLYMVLEFIYFQGNKPHRPNGTLIKHLKLTIKIYFIVNNANMCTSVQSVSLGYFFQ